MTSAPADTRIDGENTALATAFAALANPVRLDILRHIAKLRHCGCKDITETVPLAQSSVSQHLKVLSNAGLIHIRNAHPRSKYEINDSLMQDLSQTRNWLPIDLT